MSDETSSSAVGKAVVQHTSKFALLVPFAVSVAALTIVLVLAGADAAVEVLTTAVATATVLGKFVVLRGLHLEGFLDHPYKLALLVVYLDVMVAFIAVFNTGLLFKIPRFGRRIQSIQDHGATILLANPWLGRVTFLGVVAFVMFPLSGTGAIGGALFGRLLGQSPLRTLFAIAVGGALGSFGMAALAKYFGDQMADLQGSPVLMIVGILATLGAGYWLFKRAGKLSAKG